MPTFTIETRERVELVNITEPVNRVLMKAAAEGGICLVSVPHATATLLVNEDEPGLKADFIAQFERLVPRRGRYEHNEVDDNAPAHLLASLFGPSLTLPVADGRLALGTWQQLFFVELDGPRSQREVRVAVAAS